MLLGKIVENNHRKKADKLHGEMLISFSGYYPKFCLLRGDKISPCLSFLFFVMIAIITKEEAEKIYEKEIEKFDFTTH